MSEEDWELLITLDDPGGPPEEDTFNHLQAHNTVEYWSQPNEQKPLVTMTLTEQESELSSPVHPTKRFN